MTYQIGDCVMTPTRHCDYGSHQWCAIDQHGNTVHFPKLFDHPTLGRQIATTQLFFERKRDVIAAITQLQTFVASATGAFGP